MNFLPLALVLFGGFILSMLMSYMQHLYYQRTLNAMARSYRSSQYVLASGRHKGRFRGAIAILVVDRSDPTVVRDARVMAGATILARFKKLNNLTGPVNEVLLARQGKATRMAFGDALERAKRVATESVADADLPTTRPNNASEGTVRSTAM